LQAWLGNSSKLGERAKANLRITRQGERIKARGGARSFMNLKKSHGNQLVSPHAARLLVQEAYHWQLGHDWERPPRHTVFQILSYPNSLSLHLGAKGISPTLPFSLSLCALLISSMRSLLCVYDSTVDSHFLGYGKLYWVTVQSRSKGLIINSPLLLP
jgi:hypothetical protein